MTHAASGKQILGAIVLVGLIAGGAGYWFGGRNPALTAAVPEAAGKGDGGGRKLLYYRNPMGLPDTSPVPKKDSMGMDYIPVYAGDEPDEAGVVKVSPARMQTMGVQTVAAGMQEITAAVRAVGRVEVNERTVIEVAPRFEGWIERLYVSATGDPVRRGQALFTVYSPELVSARKEVAIAEALKLDAPGADPVARESARQLADAARARLRNWEMAGSGTGGAGNGKGAQQQTFVSPANGIVLEKKAVEGMRFAPGTSIFRIADLSTVWIIADVYEKDLARLKVGQPASVEIDAFPGRHFPAKVTYLYPTLNAPTRTTPVRLELDNRDGMLRPGMFAHVELATGGPVQRLTVPSSAVIDSGSAQVVLIELGEGKFKPQPVKLGLRDEDRVEVLDGLKSGDRVVVAANFLIDAESNLKAALGSFGEAKPAAAASPRYHGVGQLESIDVTGGTVSIKHQPIPDLKWPAMTMDFNLATPEVVKGIAPGTPISFEFEQGEPGEYAIVAMTAQPAAGAR